MFQQLIVQFQKFSRENWWIYILLIFTILIVIFTGKGNLVEVLILFSINLCWAIFNMLMMSAYKDKKFSEWSVFILIANTLYTILSLYAWLHDGDMQYIFWQTSFLLTGIQAFMFYTHNINLKFINFYSIFILNSCVLLLLIEYIGVWIFVLIQSLGIALVTLWLSLRYDTYRYLLILTWNLFLVIWSLLIFSDNYASGNILGVTVAYTLLWLSTFVYYLKLLPTYLSRLKNI